MDKNTVTLIAGLGMIFLIPICVYWISPSLDITVNRFITWMVRVSIKCGKKRRVAHLKRKLEQIQLELDTENDGGNESYWELDKSKREIEDEIKVLEQAFV